jgi:RimJ/RimL family protein N-acetyltransferase
LVINNNSLATKLQWVWGFSMYDLNKFSGDFLTVFERLAVDIVNESADQNGMAEERLWSLPEAIISYHQNSPVSAQNENKESMVAALRYHSAKHFHEIPDFQNKITRLRSHLKEQERSFELARWSESDLDAYVSLLGDEDVWQFIPEDYPAPLTPEDALSLIETSNNVPERHQVHKVVYEGEIIGQVRILFDQTYPGTAEISYWLGKKFWGKGLASLFVPLYTSKSFLWNQGLKRIYAKVLDGNDASCRVLEKSNYKLEFLEYKSAKKKGQFYNAKIFGVYRGMY